MDDMQEETNKKLDNEPGQGSEPVPQYPLTLERGDEVELAETLIKSLGPDVIYDEGDFYRYDPTIGIWKPLSSESLTASLSRFAGSPVISPRHILQLNYSKIFGALKIARAQRMGIDSYLGFVNAAPGVAFRNGFVSVYDGQVYLEPHDPAHMSRHAYPFDYFPDEPCPMLDEFFAQVFAEDEPEERVQQVLLIQEFIGASLIGEATRYQCALIFLGNGANGKSTCLDIAESIFPPHSVTSLPPQNWGKQFSIASLVGCLANLVNEIPENDIVANSIFKSIISGEPVRGEHKFQTSFKFRPRAGHVFAANSLPATNDQSEGF